MSNKYIISINTEKKRCEELFLVIMKNYLQKNSYNYEQFFFSIDRKNTNEKINIYFEDKEIIEKYIINEYKDKPEIKCIKNLEFNCLEDNFGILGNEFLSKFYKISNKMAIDIMRDCEDNYAKKLAYVLDIMIISAHINYGSIKNGYLSYASHANAFFTNWKDMNHTKQIFDKKYLSNKSYVISRIKELTINDNLDSNMKEFIKKFIQLKSVAKEELKQGNLGFKEIEYITNNNSLLRSEFHKAIADNDEFSIYMKEDFEFLSSRLFTIFTYFFLRNIGLKNNDRYLLGYYIYKGVEEKFNIDSVSAIKSFRVIENL